ncbi:Ig-like domain-containing protein, partial [Hymenobacter sp.]|uniref:Ig-like domain-containing protein n=1 Tax=Hymenobacter sp. TaxID=1898978 RepID=UPI0039C89437
MPHSYSPAQWTLRIFLLLAPSGAALAQAPVITSVVPLANARAAACTSPLTVSFSQPLTAASVGALKVFSSQKGGLRSRSTTPASVSGSTLSFTPSASAFMPGETVQYTVTTAAGNSGGTLARPRVAQFTTAAGGTGIGAFQFGSDV